MGRSSRRTVTPSTWGTLPVAKAPSPREDRTKGMQRTRKLSTGKGSVPWSCRKGKERFVGQYDHGEGLRGLSRVR